MERRLPEKGSIMEEGTSPDVPLKSSAEIKNTEPPERQNHCIVIDDDEPPLISAADQKRSVSSSGIRCPYCRYLCGSKFSFQIHVGSKHPLRCDEVPVGRLGKVVFYQSTAELFHCHLCFFTSKDYAVVFQHLLARHCMADQRAALPDREPREKCLEEQGATEPEENPLKRKRSSMSESDEESEEQRSRHVHLKSRPPLHQCPYCIFQSSLREVRDHLTQCRVQEASEEQC